MKTKSVPRKPVKSSFPVIWGSEYRMEIRFPKIYTKSEKCISIAALELNIAGAKKLHAWLGKSIQYLESKKE